MAIPNEQANEASRTGGVLSPASKNPNSPQYVEYAGLISSVLKNLNTVDSSVTGGKKVALPNEERLLTKGTTNNQVQDSMAEEILSEDGLKRFNENRKVAVSGKEMLQPQNNLVKMADDEFEASQQILDDAKLAVNEKPRGLANEGDSLDLLTGSANAYFKTDKGIDFNFDKMNSSEDVLSVINGVSEIVSKETDEFKRGVVSNTQTVDEAIELLSDETGFTKSMLKSKIGTTLNASQMTALRMLLQNSAEKISKLGDEIIAGADSNDNLLKYRRLVAIHSGLQMRAKGAQTEIARAMQAFTVPVGARNPINIGNIKNELLNESGGREAAMDLVNAIKKGETEGGKKGMSEAIARGWAERSKKVFQEIYINGLLANTKTALKNLLATPLYIAYNQLTDIVAASTMTVVRSGQKALGKEINPDGVFFSDIFARNMGMMQSFKDAWLTAYKTAKTEIPAGRTNKIEGFNAIDSEFLGQSGSLGTAINWLGRSIRVPGAALQSADDFWRVIVQRGAHYEEAMKAARISSMNGATDKDALDNGMMIILDPNAVRTEIDYAGNRMLLTEDLDGSIGRFTKIAQNYFLGKMIIPFAKAPTNAIRLVAESHPLSVLFSPKIRGDLLGTNGKQSQQQAMSRMAVGSMTMYQIYQWSEEGRLTGALPQDPKIRAMLPPNWQPYSFVFRGEGFPNDEDGDPLPLYDNNGNPNGKLTYVNYTGFEPVSAIIGIAAECAETNRRLVKQTDRMHWATACSAATMKYFKEIPFLQGMSSVFAAIEYNDPGIIIRSPMNNMFSVIPVPFSATLRVKKKATDPQKVKSSVPISYYTIADAKKLFDESKLTKNPLDMVPYHLVGTVKNESAAKQFYDGSVLVFRDQMKSNPWYKKTMDDYQYLYDAIGNKKTEGVSSDVNPVQAYWNQMTPFGIKFGEEMPEWQKILVNIGMPLKEEVDVIEGIELSNANKGQLNFIAKDPQNENAIKFQISPGTAVLPFQEYLEQYVKTYEFVNATRKEQINLIKGVENDFYEAAFQQLMRKPENEDLYNAYKERNENYVQGAR